MALDRVLALYPRQLLLRSTDFGHRLAHHRLLVPMVLLKPVEEQGGVLLLLRHAVMPRARPRRAVHLRVVLLPVLVHLQLLDLPHPGLRLRLHLPPPAERGPREVAQGTWGGTWAPGWEPHRVRCSLLLARREVRGVMLHRAGQLAEHSLAGCDQRRRVAGCGGAGGGDHRDLGRLLERLRGALLGRGGDERGDPRMELNTIPADFLGCREE
mmetsp:Transcript_19456/g.47080  ORF Transcript_19456/g.47080 Transcript_19456/m.47080 type:complete len:212 (-) Transcript_19456:158-793(-)